MKTPRYTMAGAILALLMAGGVARGQTWNPNPPLHPVATLLLTWHDDSRNRDVPVKIYYPADAKAPCPLIIFSHGLGGSRMGYGYLGQGWAQDGYISVHPQHLGSDDAVWRDAGVDGFAALQQSVTNPQNAINRALDIPFVIDKMLALNKTAGSPLKGLVNPDEIGMSGHSFGAWTTMALVGQKMRAGVSFLDPRIKSGIAMSAPVPGGAVAAAGQFTDIKVPVFHMTGTLDDSPIGETKAADRRIPYDQSTTPGTCLVIFKGADHMVFSGRGFGAADRNDARYQALILPASLAFWDATLRGDAAAKTWLYDGGFVKLLGDQGIFEKR